MWNHECEHKTSQRSRKTQGISIWGHSQYIFFKKAKKKSKRHCLNLTNRCFLTQKKKYNWIWDFSYVQGLDLRHHTPHNHPKKFPNNATILNSNARELKAQLFPQCFFLLKCLYKIVWKYGGLSPLYLLFFQMWSHIFKRPSFHVPLFFKVCPHKPLVMVQK